MKTRILVLLLLVTITGFAQKHADTLHSQVFCLSPASAKVEKVNGMALGIGHFWSSNLPKKINGFNLEINPLTPIIVMFQDPDRTDIDSLRMTVNGLHLSTGGFAGGIKLNGVGVSVYNISYASNGFSITGLYNVTRQLNGFHISGLYNEADKARGLLIAGANHADDFGGARIGVYNKSVTSMGLNIGLVNISTEQMQGVQIGLFNKTAKCKGLQIGVWNINGKRSFPFINW